MSTYIHTTPAFDCEPITTEAPIYIDLGTRRRKSVQRLRRGEGPLALAVEQAIGDLRASNEIAGDCRVVVVVVRERPQTPFDIFR